MALLAFWKNNREHVLKQNIQQILSNAGDGKLTDGSKCSKEFRQFLREVPSEHLMSYIIHCLDQPFPESDLVLQDLINEIGRRLDFEVEDGPYRGNKTTIGFDGVWRSTEFRDILIEVKTTDYVTISLDKIADYKRRLIQSDNLNAEASMLIVVGREDTGALEAQVRGSRFAWEMRLVSTESLIKLLKIKEKSNEEINIHKIKELLQPFEYTKIDKIIDVVFSTTIDVEQQVIEEKLIDEDAEADAISNDRPRQQVRTDREEIDTKRQEAADGFGRMKKLSLLKYRRTLFWTTDRSTRLCVAVSKNYNRDYQPYWYAFHPTWNNFLKEGKDSYFILSCMDLKEAYAIPYKFLKSNLENLNVSKRDNGKYYWHISLIKLETGSLAWNLSKVSKKIDLTPFTILIKA